VGLSETTSIGEIDKKLSLAKSKIKKYLKVVDASFH
jgi:hypothetical protein